MKKKLLSLLLTTMVMTSALPVMAAEYSADGNQSVTVTAELGSTYTVSVPTAVSLTYNSVQDKYTGTYTVGAKGNIATNKKVVIAPHANSFNLTGTSSSTVVAASVSQTKTDFVAGTPAANELAIGTTDFTTTTGSIVAPITVADSYSGNMQIDFSLQDK